MSPSNTITSLHALAIFDALPVGIAMIDTEGKLLHCNKTLAVMLGTSHSQFMNVPCRHFLRSRLCVTGCPLGCQAFGSAKSTNQEQQEAIHIEDIPTIVSSEKDWIETDIIAFNKTKVPVRLKHFPVLDDQNAISFYIDIVEDISKLHALEMQLQQAGGNGKFVGRSLAIEKIQSLFPSFAASKAPILLTGETGTGKDLLAETLHVSSHRSRSPFVRVSISPLPLPLLMEELFGSNDQLHSGKLGKFQQAAGGTLYISELADIPPTIQTQLIHFLDEGTITPQGGTPTLLDTRLITATNKNVEELIANGTLFAELYYRLNVSHIHLPPLRERQEDVDFLLQHFLEMYAKRFKKQITGFSAEVRAILASHHFSGNVRELRNIVEYASMVCQGSEIGIDSLPASFSIPTAKMKKKK